MGLEISITNGVTVIDLPPDLDWRDEFDWTPVEHSTDYSLAGNLVVQEGERQDGRPITLYGGREVWVERSTVEALYDLAKTPGQLMTLALWGRSFSVMFRRPAIEARPIRRLANPGSEHYYAITVNLMEITP
ncbi:hypothetical protein [Marinobacter sp. X15-166B]|uniref:hypothetical protein n=1 Tax=Marinobacter sp. X15-166B TaxID=1897620 RepID=UPI00085C39D4|nr:hypothetical protein [Marinobacter sp. X15-166B]OEY66798.1 hypothetical protein BG841_10255 [Marinobacter sp. X15-166B]